MGRCIACKLKIDTLKLITELEGEIQMIELKKAQGQVDGCK